MSLKNCQEASNSVPKLKLFFTNASRTTKVAFSGQKHGPYKGFRGSIWRIYSKKFVNGCYRGFQKKNEFEEKVKTKFDPKWIFFAT